ncbi:Leucine Rich Repeat family protein [Histomonas meleagridis]|uniref:Leucine Rich Repeat family protein n=1 Tax=Histomonas meleagridis TaxID=135588 RepID=UPI00355A5563|nr:Leucine Rich Repeat family protein [Histomonas meleagridis]KAH0803358.1 Leucine Rich Repeat family protein [Histomonas meleagridis]
MNPIDESKLKVAQEFLETSLEIPVVCLKAEKIGSKNKKDSKLFVAASTGLFIFQKGKKNEFAAPRKLDWLGLLSLSLTSHKSLLFQFTDEKIEITHKDYVTLAEIIRKHLCSFMKEKELPIFSFPEISSEKHKIDPILRFHNIITNKCKEISNDALKNYQAFFRSMKKEIYLSSFLDILKVSSEPFFEAIQSFPYFTSIFIDTPVGNTMLTPLMDFLRCTRHIQNIYFNNIVVINEMPSTILSKSVQNISVKKVRLNKNVSQYFGYLAKNSLNEMSFEDCLSGSNFSDFVEAAQSFKSLRNLSIKKSQDIKLDSLLKLGKDLHGIKLIDCGIDVCEFLGNLESFPQIETIDLSSNFAKEPIKETFDLPSSLKTVILNHVTFSNSVLYGIFELFSRCQNPISLSLSNIELDNWTFEDLFDCIQEFPHIKVDELYWDNNNIDDSFFKYIRDIPTLKLLSLYNCLPNCVDSCYSLGKFILKSTTLETINLSVDKSIEIGDSEIKSIFESITHNTSLKLFSIKGFKYTNTFIQELIKCLLENIRIKEFEYDFPCVYKGFNDFLTKVCNRGAPLMLKKDLINKFLTDNNIKQKYEHMIQGDSEYKVPVFNPNNKFKLNSSYKKTRAMRREQRNSTAELLFSFGKFSELKNIQNNNNSDSEVKFDNVINAKSEPDESPMIMKTERSLSMPPIPRLNIEEESKPSSRYSMLQETEIVVKREPPNVDLKREMEYLDNIKMFDILDAPDIEYEKKEVIEEKWEIVVDEVRPIDLGENLKQIANEFNVNRLLEKIRND